MCVCVCVRARACEESVRASTCITTDACFSLLKSETGPSFNQFLSNLIVPIFTHAGNSQFQPYVHRINVFVDTGVL